MRLVGKFRRALHLRPADWWLLARCWALLLAFDWGLRWLPFPRVQAAAARGGRKATPPGREAEEVIEHTRCLLEIAARHHLYPMTCLRQALALQWLLGQRGVVTELRLGVRGDHEGIEAHAWLEYAGLPIGGATGHALQFTPFAGATRAEDVKPSR